MFLDNKYYKWYMQLTSNKERELNCYTENHHIIPKSMGGSNEKCNMVILTAREHYIAHLLLTKCVIEKFKPVMMSAYIMMALVKDKNQQRIFKVNSRLFEVRKIEADAYKREFKHTEEAKFKISQKLKGISKPVFTDIHRQNISKGHLGQVAWNKGLTNLPTTSDAQKRAVSIVNKGMITCFDTVEFISKKVKSEEYYSDKDRYISMSSKVFKQNYKELKYVA